MKKIKKLLFAFFFFFLLTPRVFAWNVSSSKGSVSPGERFTVSFSGVTGKFSVSTSGCTSSVSGDWSEGGYSFNVTAGGAGNCAITVNCSDCSDDNGQDVSGSRSTNVSIVAPATSSGDGSRSNSTSSKKGGSTSTKTTSKNNNDEEKSANNNLESLTVEGYELSPAFKSDVTSYTVEVKEEEEKIKIDAKAEDEDATITGIGEVDISKLTVFQVAVTAPNGQVKTYTINVQFKDENPIIVKKGKKEYTVVKKASLIKEFDDYKKTTIKINNIEVPALYNKTTKLTLVGLNYKDKVTLFIYDKDKNSYDEYIELDFENIKLVLLKINQKDIPKGYKKYTIKIDKQEVDVYKLSSVNHYAILYGMNTKTGKKALYVYDEVEKTIQRYDEESLNQLIKTVDQYQKFCICLATLSGLLLIILILCVIKIIELKKRIKRGMHPVKTKPKGKKSSSKNKDIKMEDWSDFDK